MRRGGEQKLLLPHQPCAGWGSAAGCGAAGLEQRSSSSLHGCETQRRGGRAQHRAGALRRETFGSACPKPKQSPGREDRAPCRLLEALGSQ